MKSAEVMVCFGGLVAGAAISAVSYATYRSATNLSQSAESLSGQLAQLESTYFGGTDDIESRIRAVARAELSIGRDQNLKALFVRMLNADPAIALNLVASMRIPHRLLSSIFESWAANDSEAAIAALGGISDPHVERLLAYAILEQANNDMDLIDRLVAAGSSLDRVGLQITTVAQLATSDLSAAFHKLDQNIRGGNAKTIAMAEVARVAIDRNPLGAIELAQRELNVAQRAAFVTEFYRQWSMRDFSAFLAHLRTRDPNQLGIETVVQRALSTAAEADARLTLQFADEIGGRLGAVARMAGLEALAADDPLSAIEYLQASPTSDQDRNQLTASLAAGYANADADAALAWVSSLEPPNSTARNEVLTQIAATNLLRAIQIELTRPTSPNLALEPPLGWLGIPFLGDLSEPAVIANAILDSDENSQRESEMLATVLSRWTDSDPHAAIAWMRTNSAIPDAAIRAVARKLGEVQDIEAAVQFSEFIEPQRRSSWIEAAIVSGALYDPTRAMEVLGRYRDESFYDAAVSSIVRTTVSRLGPEFAAGLLREDAAGEAPAILAAHWAATNPTEAVRWVMRLSDRRTQSNAIAAIAAEWARYDSTAAWSWAGGLSDAALRNLAQTSICQRAGEFCE